MAFRLVKFTPTGQAAAAYSSGDSVGVCSAVPNLVDVSGGACKLESLAVIDKSNQKLGVDVYFFDSAPGTIVAANAAFDIPVASGPKFLGKVVVAAGKYETVGASNLAVAQLLAADLNPIILKAAAGTKTIYCTVVSRGTPTYGAAAVSIQIGVSDV